MGGKKVLIIYASIGTGHFSAADALRTALCQCEPDTQVEMLDIFTSRMRAAGLPGVMAGFSTVALPRAYDRSWRTGSMGWAFELVRKAPWLERRVIHQARRFMPDVIVCTHALPCAIAAACLQDIPLVAVATDFVTHPYWPVEHVDAFIIASDLTSPALVSRGFPIEKIHSLGIPIRPEIVSLSDQAGEPHSSSEIRALVLAGGGQAGPYLPVRPVVDALVNTLARGPVPGVTWEFVFGNNRELQRRAARKLAARRDISLYGFVNDLPLRMSRASVVLTKPGGLVLAEAMALRKPVILLTQGAGQEAANLGAVLAAGAGVQATRPDRIIDQLQCWKDSPHELERVQLNTCRLGSPDSAGRSARLILSM